MPAWVTRNGQAPERPIRTGIGPVEVRRPRVPGSRRHGRCADPVHRRDPAGFLAVAKYDEAAACPAKDCAALLAFHDFPAEPFGRLPSCGTDHRLSRWQHVRTSNPIDSTVETIRLRAFADPLALSEPERIEDGEQRWQTLGLVEGHVLLVVAHTLRDEEEDGRHVEVIRIVRRQRLETVGGFREGRISGSS